jgi:hypothetical protein
MTVQDQYHLESESDDAQPGAEYTEWDNEGNVIARGWNAHPDRCVHCGAWGAEDHMAACPDHEPQDVIAAAKNGDMELFKRILYGKAPAQFGLTSEMKARKVRKKYNSNHEFLMLDLVAVPFPVFLKELELLKAQGYVAYDAPAWASTNGCPACGCNHGTGADYAVALPHGGVDLSQQRSFGICISCFMVTEWVDVDFPVHHQTTRKAVKTLTKSLRTNKRVKAVHCASRKGKTAPQPNRSGTAQRL